MEHQHKEQPNLHDHGDHVEHNHEHKMHEYQDSNPPLGHIGHDHHKMMIVDFKRRFLISTIITLPVLLLSPMIQDWINVGWKFTGDNIVLFTVSSIIFFYGGWPFLKGIFDELRKGNPGMMTLIAIAISTAYFYSTAVIFGFKGKTFFWELATLIDVMLLGHWIEMKSILGASKALEALAALMPDEANLVKGENIEKVKVNSLQKGDVILVKPGEKVPADGLIIDGESDLNESMLTGESKPVHKTTDQEVIGGAINGNGALKVRIKGIGEDNYLSKVINMVRDAQKQKSKTQRLADIAAKWLTVIALGVGLGTLFIWLSLGKDFSFSLERMVTVMVICCPHALGLAVPLVAAISTSISASNGLLIRNRTAFENARKISTIVFDKTGTLTKGSHDVVRIVPYDGNYDEKELLRITAATESPSEHHISKGLIRKAKEFGMSIPVVKDFKYEAGIGVKGTVDGNKVQVGGYLLLGRLGIETPEKKNDAIETIIFTVVDDKLIGSIVFADQIRESSFAAIKKLRESGIKCMLLTGDNKNVAAAVAKKLNLNDYMAEVLPSEKQEMIKKLQKDGEFVAMTGDGVNDAPALAQSDVGIAIGSGTDVAAETADIILVDSDPQDIANLIFFGKATYRKMVQNLAWATGYNLFALPLATGFVPGIVISPAFGAGLMAISTVICAGNAQLLKREIKK